MTKIDLKETFGMYEMELAAGIIINGCNKAGRLIPFDITEFSSKRSTLVGFAELIFYKWLDHANEDGGYNGVFIPNDDFINMVAPYLPLDWIGTQENWMEEFSQ